MRLHGRAGVAYLSLNSGDAATPMAFMSDWTISWTASRFETTTFADTQRKYGSTQPEVAGEFSGYFDSATAQSYAAAVDGQPRNLYLYPSVTGTMGSEFFSGQVIADFSAGGGVTSAVSVKCTWSASSTLARSAPYGVPDSPGAYTATYLPAY